VAAVMTRRAASPNAKLQSTHHDHIRRLTTECSRRVIAFVVPSSSFVLLGGADLRAFVIVLRHRVRRAVVFTSFVFL
jgi:cob(I)alamin adenosyltransferase